MERTIEIDDHTQLTLEMIGWGTWKISVGGLEVPHQTKKCGRGQIDITCELPDGRTCVIEQRPYPVASITFDVRIGDQLFVDPGKRPFTCLDCGRDVLPRAAVCAACGAQQPNATARLYARAKRNVAIQMQSLAFFLLLIGTLPLLSVRSQVSKAVGELDALQRNSETEAQVKAVVYSSAGLDLAVNVALVAITFVLSVLAKRQPLLAAGSMFGLWFVVFLFEVLARTTPHWLFLAFHAYLLLSMLRIVNEARRTRALRPA